MDNANSEPPTEQSLGDQFYASEEGEPAKAVVTEPIEKEIEVVNQEVEESKEVKSEATDEDKESYIDLDGVETNLSDIREWRDHGLMQKDYSKKTEKLAKDRKTFEAERNVERDVLLNMNTETTARLDLLKVLTQEDSEVNWAELKEEEPERYIELKERADKRKEALLKVKAERSLPNDPALVQTEQRKLYEANPDWLDDGKTTETYQKDTQLINDYAVKAGFTREEFSKMTHAHFIITLLKAAKYEALQEKGRKIADKREKVSVVLKPKGKSKTEPQLSIAERLYGG